MGHYQLLQPRPTSYKTQSSCHLWHQTCWLSAPSPRCATVLVLSEKFLVWGAEGQRGRGCCGHYPCDPVLCSQSTGQCSNVLLLCNINKLLTDMCGRTCLAECPSMLVLIRLLICRLLVLNDFYAHVSNEGRRGGHIFVVCFVETGVMMTTKNQQNTQ